MNFGLIKSLLKQWQILLVLICVVGSFIIIAPSPGQKGVVVTSVASDSPLFGKVQIGETITWANEKEINSPEGLNQFQNFTGTFRFMHSGKLDMVSLDNQDLGLSVVKKPSSNLQFGMDLVGGTRVLLKPKGIVTDAVIQQIASTLETRINVYGLKEATFQPIKDFSGNSYIQVEMAGGSKEEIENLLAKQGFFEGKIPKLITFTNNTGKLNLENSYTAILKNDSIEINNTLLKVNDSSKIEDIPFQLTNITNDSAVLFFTAFTGDDIQSVCLQDQPGICVSRVLMVSGGYEFNFQVFITKKGADRFATITKNMKVLTDPNTGNKYLDSKLYLYLDENLITALSISSELKGQAYTTPAITGFRQTRDDAIKEQQLLKSILQSGALPTSLEITRVDQISPALGNEFIQATMLAAIAAAIAVSIVLYIRYRNFKILIPNILWSFFEVVLTLGVAAIIKWTIDLASIAGIIAAIGEGTNEQTMMIDEIRGGGTGEEDRTFTLRQRLKRAFFIIVGTGTVIMMSVVPMIFIGVGVMKGFAITTLIGTFIGTILTRPAFSIVAQKVLEGKISKTEKKEEKEVEKSLEKKIESEAKKEEVSKEEIIKKEWKKLMDITAKELFNKPFNDLTPEQKEEIKKIVLEVEEKETRKE
jgi:preprotein translocase subunit SecD